MLVETFKPIGDRVVLLELKETEIGGINLPDSYEGKDQRYKVIAISNNVERDHGSALKVGGEVIAVTRPNNHFIEHTSGKCRIMSYKDIKAVVS